MTTLQHAFFPVQPESPPAPAPPPFDDAAWWAAEVGDGAGPEPEPHTDRAWLLAEAEGLSLRARSEDDPSGHLRLAADTLKGLAAGMGRGRHERAGGYVLDPHTPPRPGAGGRLNVRLPRPGSRRSPLAAGLDVLAAWFLHLDTDAGDLAAWELEWTAGLADELGSETAADYFIDEAAWLMAMHDVGADDDVIATFDPSEL